MADKSRTTVPLKKLLKADDAIAATVDGELRDLDSDVAPDAVVEGVMRQSDLGLHMLRHSTAHLLAQAVQELFPETKVTIGPVIEDGFYYDFDRPEGFKDSDLPVIEKKMREIAKRNLPIERREVSRGEARDLFDSMGEQYKVEIIDDRPDKVFSIYQQGEWLDLCRGPHMPRTGDLRVFKLLKIAGAYWKGDEKNRMLTRIYGTAFRSKDELKAHMNLMKEAERRDHRRLGKELDLFSTNQDIGPGIALWHPKGALIRYLIEEYWRQRHFNGGYDLVFSPHMARAHLWDRSGHTEYYEENMYPRMDVEGQDYFIKPMNCPFHVQIYKSQLRSYRDLPLRWAELGTVYRYERSGVLHGLMRVRGFTQDDAHLFMTPEQLDDEIVRVIEFVRSILSAFGFSEYEVYLSTRPEKYVGSLENWETATTSLKNALEKVGLDYKVDPGEGVFYGPKIDIKIRDSLRRSWQCSTIQVDFNLPERFEMEYVDRDGERKRPIMVHRALLGSLERFFGILIEHYAGAFPFWLAPEQIRIVNISDAQLGYCDELVSMLKEKGYRVHLDGRNEKLGFKIREAQKAKIPYALVIGNDEVDSRKVSVRRRDGETVNGIPWEELENMLKQEEAPCSK